MRGDKGRGKEYDEGMVEEEMEEEEEEEEEKEEQEYEQEYEQGVFSVQEINFTKLGALPH